MESSILNPSFNEPQLTWSPAEFHELFPTISDDDQCDLGFLDQNATEFRLATYVAPLHFPWSVAANQAIQVTIVAKAHNGRSEPLVVEVAWDGVWSSNLAEMKKHLIVKLSEARQS